jgi:3-deoxy-manno-octulosonate cytidylyltransferase (CMP-KDO synthetase)
MATLACRWPAAAREDPSIVKVVTDLRGRALYFSRSGIPFVREPSQVPIWRHLGLYGYSRQVLLEFQSWSPTPLELAEGLEQLRFLENGVTIAVESVEDATPAVDLPEHADTIRQLLQVRAS